MKILTKDLGIFLKKGFVNRDKLKEKLWLMERF